jgi:hypothetical protein
LGTARTARGSRGFREASVAEGECFIDSGRITSRPKNLARALAYYTMAGTARNRQFAAGIRGDED